MLFLKIGYFLCEKLGMTNLAQNMIHLKLLASTLRYLPQLKAAKVNVNSMTYLNPLLMRNDRVTRQADGFHVSLLELGSQFSHSTEFSCAYRSKVCGMGEENTPSENTITSYWRTNIFNALPVTCGSNKFINL